MKKIKYFISIVLILSGQSVYAANLLYSTGFETETSISEVFYTNNTDFVGYPPDSKVALTTSNPHSGKKSIRGNVFGGISGKEYRDSITGMPANHDPHLSIGMLGGTPAWGTYHSIEASTGKLYISYWMRWDDGANFSRSTVAGDQGICAMMKNPGGYKMVLMSAQGGMNQFFMNATRTGWSVYDGLLQMKESTDSVGTGTNNNGVWHHYEYYIQYETTSNPYNGILRAWRNGVKIYEKTNLQLKMGGSKYVSFQMIQYTGSACASSGYQIDDIEIWDDMPSTHISPNPPIKLSIR